MFRYRWLTSVTLTLGAVACGSDSGGGGSAAPPVVIDLVADSNRDGVVDALTDQEGEDQWDAKVGASFIANLDDDDLDGKRDCDDDIINGEADKLDLATFKVSGWPDAPPDAEGVVRIEPEAAESVRIFKQNLDGSTPLVMGSMGACSTAGDCSYVLEAKLTNAEVLAGATFLIEGRRFKGMDMRTLNPASDEKRNAWTGLVDLSYEVDKAGTGERYASKDVPDGYDHVKLRVAPWVLFGSLGPHDTMYSSEASPEFVQGNTDAAQASGVKYTPYPYSWNQDGGWSDIWTEDFFQTGWTGFPGPNGTVQGMRIFNSRPWGRPPQNASKDVVEDYHPIRWIMGNPERGRPAAAFGPDLGAAELYSFAQRWTGNTQDSHGNHDLVPPFDGYPMGRIIHGNKILTSTALFYNTQGVQGPAIVLDTTWLAVEHVDEFFHWVPANTPRGWKLLVASPVLMTKMLEDLAAKGQGSGTLHQGKGGSFETSVSGALANTQLMKWSQVAEAKIQGHIDIMKAETGITDADIIEIPTWFEDLGNEEKVAWNPGMVNMRMLGNVADIAKPYGPDVGGGDPFEADIVARLGSPASQLGADGQGLKIHFTDDWFYHEALGEVHCGTNESAPAPFAKNFWWESGK
ncbi:MAG: hypothetical protein IPI67_26250 [Myxococcales bacterium]|nr:hypothetical protein [Myxococcales bacterium]